MKVKKSSSLLILVLMLSSVAIGFLGFAVLTSSQNPVIDAEPIDLGYKIREGHYGLDTNLETLATSSATPKSSANSNYEVGEIKWWLYLDDYMGYYDLAQFELRAIGTIAEVWVQVNRSYQRTDPRNDPYYECPDTDGILRYHYPEVTDEHISYLLGEFENNIYSSVTGVFGEPLPHDGTDAALPGMVGLPPDYYYEETGRNVILVSNIRDTMYYDIDYPYFIGGFYSPSFEFYNDRNIISIDSHQWYRRMGPEDDQWWSYARDQWDPPVDRPYLFETLIAHEYQHLIHDDNNPADELFMNEACSMYAETVCGYPWETGDIECFLATPDNSLTDWGDHGGINILADYGAAFLWALYLSDHFGGSDFLGHFVQAGIPGIEGINAALEYFQIPLDFDDVFHDWRIANLIHSDHPGDGRYNYTSIDLGALETQARVYWAKHEERGTDFGNTITDLGYDTGVSMIGSYGTDYIGFDKLKGLNFILFNGDSEATFLHWEMVDGMWYSGEANLMNTLIAAEVDVDPLDPTLNLYTYWDIEDYWDFGFVQVSTDDGNTWTSLANDYTTEDHFATHPDIIPNLPGLTSWSGFIDPDGWIDMTFDLSAYAEQTIQIGFRYMTDWGTLYEGWYIGGAMVGADDIMGDLQLLDYVPEVNWMVSIVTKKTYKHRGKTYSIYSVDDMFIFDQHDWGLDLVWVGHRDEVFVLISPMMDFGMADYGFDTYRLKWRWH